MTTRFVTWLVFWLVGQDANRQTSPGNNIRTVLPPPWFFKCFYHWQLTNSGTFGPMLFHSTRKSWKTVLQCCPRFTWFHKDARILMARRSAQSYSNFTAIAEFSTTKTILFLSREVTWKPKGNLVCHDSFLDQNGSWLSISCYVQFLADFTVSDQSDFLDSSLLVFYYSFANIMMNSCFF